MARTRQPENLTAALARLLTRTLLPDLRERTKLPAVAKELQREYDDERAAKKTGASFIDWREQLLDQVAAAWALSCVFVRTLEDRDLLDQRRIAGPGADDSLHLFYTLAPSLGPREYLLGVFKEVSRLPGAVDLLGPKHNAAWKLGPSQDGARALHDFFREVDDAGELRWQFGGEDTRFLGDLYQDLSEAVRERFALLQTPEFVESFILDRTLTPAIAEFGLQTVQVLDPTCGSGHFLLGAFEQLFNQRLAATPGAELGKVALAALQQVHGVDLNPYAVAIARFRLTLRFLQVTGIGKLRNAPRELDELTGNLVVADSLLIEAGGQRHAGELFPSDEGWGKDVSIFALDEPEAARELLRKRFHIVVGNPPYITCKDAVLREAYRAKYTSAAGKYALSAPFAERFFQLGSDGAFVGQITSNSFMKREFGKSLIEQVFPHLDLTEIIDTSGAYIPGHGTPTVILVGRNRPPVHSTVFAIQGKRGEPSTPLDPASGRVWTSIVSTMRARDEGVVAPDADEFISNATFARKALAIHPWSLGGGGASELKEVLDQTAHSQLGSTTSIGIGSISAADEVHIRTAQEWARVRMPPKWLRQLVTGDIVRDWLAPSTEQAWHPYGDSGRLAPPDPAELSALWRFRTILWDRATFSGRNYRSEGRPWYEWHQVTGSRYATPLSLNFACVATHNHFVLDKGGSVFNRSAPVIKLPADASVDDHLAVLGVLNSSVACFWIKQVFYPKASASKEAYSEPGKPEDNRYDIAATGMESFPMPDLSNRFRDPIIECARSIDRLARTRARVEPLYIVAGNNGSAQSLTRALADADANSQTLLNEMVAWQEELDWLVYSAYGLTGDVERIRTPSPVRPEDRPFAWVNDDGPAHLPLENAQVYRQRRKLILENRNLALIETPVFKRLWLGQRGIFGHNNLDYKQRTTSACKAWLLDRLESWSQDDLSRPFSIREATQALQHEPAVQAVAEVLTGSSDYDLERVLTDLALTDAVPAIAAQRYSDIGMEKRAAWEKTWDLQRKEDAGETVDIPVPPKYGQPDFRSTTYWQLRGKLDVPKERFVHLPGAERDDDPSPVLLWAGADHLQRALAMAALYQDREAVEGWDKDRLLPLLVGVAELVPWIKQWHNEPGRGGQRMGEYFAKYVEDEARKLGKSVDDLAKWRPMAKVRKGRGKA